MASFNPQTQDTGVPDLTSASRGPGVNRTFETLFSGLADTAENVLKVKDTQTQLDIQDQASNMFDSVNKEFGLDTPVGMTDGLDQIQVLKNAVDQGKLSEVNYYGRLATLSKQLRSKYPGYEHIVDQTIQSVTGTRPANAYRDAILQEMSHAASEASSADKFQRQYVKENEGIIASIFPDYFESPGKYSFDQLQIGVSKYKAKDEAISSRVKELQLNSAENQFNDVQAKKTIDQDFSFITQSFLTSATGANDPSFGQKINDFVAKGGGKPEEINSFIGLITQGEAALRAKLYQRGQSEYVAHGILSNDDLNKAIDNAMYPLTKAKEAVLGGDFKLASRYATINKVVEDKQVNDLFNDPDIRVGNGLNKISTDLGMEWFSKTQDAIFGRVQDTKAAQIGDEIAGQVMNGNTTILSKAVDQGDSALTKSALNSSFNVLIDPNANSQNVHNVVQSLFGPDAKNWMDRRVVNPEDMETLYTKFLDPKVTAAIFSKGSDEDKSTYFQWAMTKARSIPAFAAAAGDINSLNAGLKDWNSQLQLRFDPKTMRVSVVRPTGLDDREVSTVWKPYGRAVDAMNKVFAVMAPIIDASGQNREEVAKAFAKSLSISLDGVNPSAKGPGVEKGGFWSWVYDGLTSNALEQQSKEAAQESFNNLTTVPEVVQDVGTALSEAGSDLMKPLGEVSQGDTGEIDFLNTRPEATSLTEETTKAASSPITGMWEEFRDAKTPLELASKFDGLSEKTDRDTISEFIKKAAGIDIDPAKTAWCAAFVNGVLGAKGLSGTGRLNARSFLDWGQPVRTPTKGDIVILERNGSSWQGHVGFLVSEDKDTVTLLGGNQSNKVSQKTFPKSRVLGYRRPIQK